MRGPPIPSMPMSPSYSVYRRSQPPTVKAPIGRRSPSVASFRPRPSKSARELGSAAARQGNGPQAEVGHPDVLSDPLLPPIQQTDEEKSAPDRPDEPHGAEHGEGLRLAEGGILAGLGVVDAAELAAVELPLGQGEPGPEHGDRERAESPLEIPGEPVAEPSGVADGEGDPATPSEASIAARLGPITGRRLHAWIGGEHGGTE